MKGTQDTTQRSSPVLVFAAKEHNLVLRSFHLYEKEDKRLYERSLLACTHVEQHQWPMGASRFQEQAESSAVARRV